MGRLEKFGVPIGKIVGREMQIEGLMTDWRGEFARQVVKSGERSNEKTTSEDVVFNIWWRIRDSNPGHKDYDSSALTD